MLKLHLKSHLSITLITVLIETFSDLQIKLECPFLDLKMKKVNCKMKIILEMNYKKLKDM